MEEQISKWIKEVKSGCSATYKPIVLFYQEKIYHHCLKMLKNAHEAEDITQETFLRAYLYIHTFDEKRNFSTWLFTIATNLTIDRIRKRKPDFYLDAEVNGEQGLTMYSHLASSASNPSEEAESRELRQYLYEQIENLPVIYRQVVVLRFFYGFTLQHISEVLNTPAGTIKVRLFRARKTLQKSLSHIVRDWDKAIHDIK